MFSVGIALLALSASASGSEVCDESRLQRALLEHDKARIEFQYKMQTGFIRKAKRGDMTIARERNRYLYDGGSSAVRAIVAHLGILESAGGALALVYEPQPKGCAWLISPDGDVRGALTTWTPGIASAIRERLGATTRSARLMPRQFAALPATHDDRAVQSLDESALGGVSLEQLTDQVVPPDLMREIVRRGRTLLVLPASDIGSLPFAALRGSQADRYLIDFVVPIILPSVDGLFFWVESKPINSGSPVLIVGDPDLSGDHQWRFAPLPGARDEAKAVSKLVGAHPLIGGDADLDSVRKALNDSNLTLLYFATHGIADGADPIDRSFLALRGGYLSGADIKRLFFPSTHPLVVMSACQSGLGKVFTGGVFGLARAWIYSGASQVVASQWNVDDPATANLMKNFIKGVQDGYGVQRSFQRAIVATRSMDPDVVKWGAFNLYGYPQPQALFRDRSVPENDH